jgi:hypothetical protein
MSNWDGPGDVPVEDADGSEDGVVVGYTGVVGEVLIAGDVDKVVGRACSGQRRQSERKISRPDRAGDASKIIFPLILTHTLGLEIFACLRT